MYALQPGPYAEAAVASGLARKAEVIDEMIGGGERARSAAPLPARLGVRCVGARARFLLDLFDWT